MSDSAHYVAVADKVIASDLLYYISNKVHNTPIATIVTTCHNFYTDNDYVFNQKKQLCDATNEICHARRNDNNLNNNNPWSEQQEHNPNNRLPSVRAVLETMTVGELIGSDQRRVQRWELMTSQKRIQYR